MINDVRDFGIKGVIFFYQIFAKTRKRGYIGGHWILEELKHKEVHFRFKVITSLFG